MKKLQTLYSPVPQLQQPEDPVPMVMVQSPNKFTHENTSFYFILNLLMDRGEALVYEHTLSLGGRLYY
jgi:hypothetical protein